MILRSFRDNLRIHPLKLLKELTLTSIQYFRKKLLHKTHRSVLQNRMD